MFEYFTPQPLCLPHGIIGVLNREVAKGIRLARAKCLIKDRELAE